MSGSEFPTALRSRAGELAERESLSPEMWLGQGSPWPGENPRLGEYGSSRPPVSVGDRLRGTRGTQDTCEVPWCGPGKGDQRTQGETRRDVQWCPGVSRGPV